MQKEKEKTEKWWKQSFAWIKMWNCNKGSGKKYESEEKYRKGNAKSCSKFGELREQEETSLIKGGRKQSKSSKKIAISEERRNII